MKPALRKFTLTAHITFSVGWLGAVAAYLALAITGLTSHDAGMVRAAYLSMELVGWFVIVPLSLATLLAGLVESLGTQWGLFRHWWVLVKFLLTTGATVILLQHMQAVTAISGVAADRALAATDFRALRIQLVVHAGGGLLILLAATVLSVYKPWGMTPYGLRKQNGRRQVSPSDLPSRSESDVEVVPVSATRKPRWVYVVGFHAIGLALLILVVHLTGGGVRSH
ncbi:MAG TPA: hypothetical protein VFD58_08085 [Blastocatellia bacterium]|nr:hypothetical protein [Blastocatellia bacterium]